MTYAAHSNPEEQSDGIPLPVTIMMRRLAGIFGSDRRFEDYEISLMAELTRHVTWQAELEIVCQFHAHLKPGSRMFPFSCRRLLENWSCILDRARAAKVPASRTPGVELKKDPRKIDAEIALILARSYNRETKAWETDARAISDRERYGMLRQQRSER